MNLPLNEIKKFQPAEDLDWKKVKKHIVLQWYSYIARRISMYITWFFLRIPITPNQITVLGFIIGLVGCLLLTTGNYLYGILGILLIHLYTILDHCDGTVARAKDMRSRAGGFLDDIAADTVIAVMFLAIGYGAGQLLLGSIAAIFICLINITTLQRDMPLKEGK
jgi:phosphatidylglycerophosphate synthase